LLDLVGADVSIPERNGQVQKIEPPIEPTGHDAVKVTRGMGYWDAAAMMLGYTDGSGSLRSRRHFINTSLEETDRARIGRLMEQLRKRNNDDSMSSKLRPGQMLDRLI
jgi:hypothetical protein